MNDDILKLKRDYQDIEAPAYVATRIKAEVTNRKMHRRSRRPAMATVAIVVAALTVTPVLLNHQTTESVEPSPTSLSVLSSVAANKPAMQIPSLSKVKSVSMPAMPSKPTPTTDEEPQTLFETEDNPLEEISHA